MTPSDNNLFHHPDNKPVLALVRTASPTAEGAGTTSAPVQPSAVERIDKPWGHEEIVALVEGLYVGKVLWIDSGQSLSLQHHEAKDETLCVDSGHVRVEYGRRAADLRTLDLRPGERLHIPPGLVHRITAVCDSRVLETSTAAPGWRHDLVRHADRYGRTGTTKP